ncbi:unnamed protein product [Strongylus vulgaris]|uniref:Protein HIRA-like C-terminal domain-containing protein n=1 Tax=Strongylus vulgaris TaxID=40348 RepID=A0A3P7LEY8_STRVU|nr:unnamed protein product [Strongylus vulgaris]
MKAILSRQSIADCVAKDANLTSISVTPMGIPLLGFSTGTIFTFSLDMNCWQIVDSVTPLMKLCDSVDAEELPDGPVGRLLKRRKRDESSITGSLSKLSDVLSDLKEQGYVCGTLRSALREDVEKIIASDPVTSSLVKSKETGGLVF